MSATTRGTLTECQASEPGAGAWIGALFDQWRQRIRERDAFAHLDERDLHDIGLSRWEVESELAKPFWRG